MKHLVSAALPEADSLCLSAAEERLYVSDAFHDVKIEVTEDGTKAAATTGRKCITSNKNKQMCRR